MSGGKRKSSSDVAGTAKKHHLLYCTTVLFKVLYCKIKNVFLGSPGGAVVENLPANAGDTGSSPGLGGSHMPRSN